jgi:dTDP-4-amino-4,6-dideoxygalactose transaminase
MIIPASPKSQYISHKREIDSAIKNVLNSESYVLGQQVKSFEKEFSSYIGNKFSVGVANGTDALEIALKTIGIKAGDEVITVSHTAIATAAAVANSGATNILVDIETDFYTIKTNELPKVLTSKTKAVIAVHLYGQSADLDELLKFCKKNNLYLIEDVSQAHGALYKGKRLGSYGDIACFSCYPTKNLGAIGDAGILTTSNKDFYQKAIMIREYGWKDRDSLIRGRNSRLDEIQAAILRVKLNYLDEDNQKRKEIAKKYQVLNSSNFITPKIRTDCSHVFHQFVCLSDRRDELMAYLKGKNILTGIHYPKPVHLQLGYSDIVSFRCLSETENISSKIISLPIYPELKPSETDKVIKAIQSFLATS